MLWQTASCILHPAPQISRPRTNVPNHSLTNIPHNHLTNQQSHVTNTLGIIPSQHAQKIMKHVTALRIQLI